MQHWHKYHLIQQLYFCFDKNTHHMYLMFQKRKPGGRSCAKAQRAFAEKFGLGRKFSALTYAILSQYWDLSRFTHFLEYFRQEKCSFGSKTVFLGQICPPPLGEIGLRNASQNKISCWKSATKVLGIVSGWSCQTGTCLVQGLVEILQILHHSQNYYI